MCNMDGNAVNARSVGEGAYANMDVGVTGARSGGCGICLHGRRRSDWWRK